MKDFLLLIVAGLVLVAIFGDGGAVLSPELSPSLEAKLDVSYAPDQSTTTIENQTVIDTNIEEQTIIYQAAPVGTTSDKGVHLIDMGPGRCAVQPGDVVESEQGNGACFVANGGQRYFINPNGARWPVDNGSGLAPVPTATAQPLQPAPAALTLEQLQAAFLRNGGELPWLWGLRSETSQYEWLSQQPLTWK